MENENYTICEDFPAIYQKEDDEKKKIEREENKNLWAFFISFAKKIWRRKRNLKWNRSS